MHALVSAAPSVERVAPSFDKVAPSFEALIRPDFVGPPSPAPREKGQFGCGHLFSRRLRLPASTVKTDGRKHKVIRGGPTGF